MGYQPKERVIFSDDFYYDYGQADLDDLRHEHEEEYGENADCPNPNYSFEDYLLDLRQEDYDNEVAALGHFFAGEPSDMSSFINPDGNNTIMVHGSIGRWDGTSTGYDFFEDLDDVLRGFSSPFKDCEITRIWDENGHLFIHGAHHDGGVEVELRQLTRKGMEAYDAVAYPDERFGPGFVIDGKRYDGSTKSCIEAFNHIFESPDLAPLPRYMEQCFGCPSVEWRVPEQVHAADKATAIADVAQTSRDASETLAAGKATDHIIRDGQDR